MFFLCRKSQEVRSAPFFYERFLRHQFPISPDCKKFCMSSCKLYMKNIQTGCFSCKLYMSSCKTFCNPAKSEIGASKSVRRRKALILYMEIAKSVKIEHVYVF
jgi:hypothetical protein